MHFFVIFTDEGLETELEDPGYANELLEDSGNLRPPTPTGSLSENEAELELRHRLSPPDHDEVELPCTPGGGFETETETPVLSPAPVTPLPPPPSPTGFHLYPSPPLHLSPPPLPSSYPAYEETPKTPGRNNREEQLNHTAAITRDAAPRMAMHSPFSPSFLSVSPHAGSGVPRTPGRDTNPSSPLSEDSEASFQQRERWRGRNPRCSHQIHIHSTSSSPYSSDSSSSETRDFSLSTKERARFDVAHHRKRRERLQRKRRTILSQRNRRNKDDFQHTAVPSSFTKSSSCDAAPGLSMELAVQAKKPLQGLENRLETRLQRGPLENQRLPEPLYPWRKRKWWPHTSLFAPRSKRRERLLINAVWTKGVNTEEIDHLKASYERMLLQNNAFDWLRSTHWVPHPHILTVDCVCLCVCIHCRVCENEHFAVRMKFTLYVLIELPNITHIYCIYYTVCI